MARSIHLKSTEQLFCNVINASDAKITLKENQALGNLSEIDIIDQTFDDDILHYVPLDTDKLEKTLASSKKADI